MGSLGVLGFLETPWGFWVFPQLLFTANDCGHMLAFNKIDNDLLNHQKSKLKAGSGNGTMGYFGCQTTLLLLSNCLPQITLELSQSTKAPKNISGARPQTP